MTVAHISGDEFAVLLSEAADMLIQASHIIQDIIQSIREAINPPLNIKDHILSIHSMIQIVH